MICFGMILDSEYLTSSPLIFIHNLLMLSDEKGFPAYYYFLL